MYGDHDAVDIDAAEGRQYLVRRIGPHGVAFTGEGTLFRKATGYEQQ